MSKVHSPVIIQQAIIKFVISIVLFLLSLPYSKNESAALIASSFFNLKSSTALISKHPKKILSLLFLKLVLMYYLIYGFLYTLSLIPWRIMYLLSDGVYLLLYHVIRYRRPVVMANLLIAFPEKTEEERIKIAKEFYHNFLD